MIKQISKKEYNVIFGESSYNEIVDECFNLVKDSDESYVFSTVCFPVKIGCEQYYLRVEFDIEKLENNANYFQILKMEFSDEKMPDEWLDRYNEVKRI